MEREDRGALVPPADGLTHLQAGEREGVLADEVVVGCGVVVFDDEADQRQLWHVHVQLEVLVPRRVETSKKGEKVEPTRPKELPTKGPEARRYRC